MCLPKTHSFFCEIIFFHLITNTLWLQNLVEDAVSIACRCRGQAGVANRDVRSETSNYSTSSTSFEVSPNTYVS